MAEKQTTMNQLAQMIKKGFDNTASKEQFLGLDKRLVEVEKDVRYIKQNLEDARKLTQRVDYIENTLNI